MPSDAPTDPPIADPSSRRLDSWKEVAAYLHRDVKTVQRWERREGLPIHRLHHDKLGSVYAYRDELDAWLASRKPATRNGSEPAVGEEVTSSTPAGEPGRPLDAGPPAAAGDAGSVAGSDDLAGQPSTGRRPRRSLIAAGLAVAAAAVLLGAFVWGPTRGREANAPEEGSVRFLVDPPANAAFAGTLVDPEPTVSPDGTRLVFRAAERDTGRQRLYLRRLDRAEADPLAGTEQGVQPFWSPDGRQLAFFAGGSLKRLDLGTGEVVTLASAPRPQGGTWLASGDIVFSPDIATGLLVLQPTSGRAAVATTPDQSAGETRHVAPEALPDGSGFLFLAEHADPRLNVVWLSTGPGGSPRRVTASPRMGRLFRGEWFVFFHDERLVASRFDATSTALDGVPIELWETLDAPDPLNRRPGFSVSAKGLLAYWPVTGTPRTRLTWFDRQGRQLASLGPAGDFPFVTLSPDGRRAAVQGVIDGETAPDVWVIDVQGGAFTRLTAAPANDENPVWAPDGEHLVYAKHTDTGPGVQLRQLSLARPLADDGITSATVGGHPTDWSRDGRTIVFQRSCESTMSDVFALSVPRGVVEPVASSPFNERHGRLSPDGRYLAYSSDVSGRLEVYVKSLAPDGTVAQVSNAGGAHPRWRRDGRELYYLSEGGLVVAVPTSLVPRFSAGTPTPLFDARPALPLVFLDTIYDVAPDGQRFLVAATERPVTTSFTVVVNALSPFLR